MMIKNLILFERLIHWLLSMVTVIYLLTGLGITPYRILESITFGLLSKNLSFNIHDNLLVPFVTLLILHMSFSMVGQRTNQK